MDRGAQAVEMGCRLNKPPKQEAPRPGNIYSTLKRPQVETKTDLAYEYRFLDFTALDTAGIPDCSAIQISSLHDLPAQLQELYQRGFVLAALHPYVQPATGRGQNPLEQIFRAVLIKKTQRSEKPDPPGEACTLVVERLMEHSVQPDFVKTVEDAATRGLTLVGIIHQCNTGLIRRGSREETPTQNLPKEALEDEETASNHESSPGGKRRTDGHLVPAANEGGIPKQSAYHSEKETEQGVEGLTPEDSGRETEGDLLPEEISKGASVQGKDISGPITRERGGKPEVFAVYNKPQTSRRHDYYSVRVPIRARQNGQSTGTLEANWLEHMTEHFKRGASLVSTAFYPGMVNDVSPGPTDGVFIFEDCPEADNKAARGFDAIVVEQLTIMEGTNVQTDYVPLLNSLAEYGWQLKCVLPTPIVKTDSEGIVTTKQIVFLQRPFLPHKAKKREPRFPWKISKDGKHGRKSCKSANDKAPTREQQSEDRTAEFTCAENKKNAGVPPKSQVIEDMNPELRNGPGEVACNEECHASPVQPEHKDSAQTVLCKSSPGSGQGEGTGGSPTPEEQDSQCEEGTPGGAEEESPQTSSRATDEEQGPGTVAPPCDPEALTN
ncbi:raftlin isoform X1 [Pleurodeles waltl]|uniref:raftlin isoform X1 n=1 Tax=Pleurodeles waltl TaxID=8319 RepID=UPI003709B350